MRATVLGLAIALPVLGCADDEPYRKGRFAPVVMEPLPPPKVTVGPSGVEANFDVASLSRSWTKRLRALQPLPPASLPPMPTPIVVQPMSVQARALPPPVQQSWAGACRAGDETACIMADAMARP